MSKLYNIDVQEERFIGRGFRFHSDDTKESLEELRSWLIPPGLFGRYDNQNREKIHPRNRKR